MRVDSALQFDLFNLGNLNYRYRSCHTEAWHELTILSSYLPDRTLDAVADYKVALIERFHDAIKMDILWYGDDWGTQEALFIPPDIWEGSKSSKLLRPTSSSFILTIIWMIFSSRLVCSRRGNATFSPTVIELNSAPY